MRHYAAPAVCMERASREAAREARSRRRVRRLAALQSASNHGSDRQTVVVAEQQGEQEGFRQEFL